MYKKILGEKSGIKTWLTELVNGRCEGKWIMKEGRKERDRRKEGKERKVGKGDTAERLHEGREWRKYW